MHSTMGKDAIWNWTALGLLAVLTILWMAHDDAFARFVGAVGVAFGAVFTLAAPAMIALGFHERAKGKPPAMRSTTSEIVVMGLIGGAAAAFSLLLVGGFAYLVVVLLFGGGFSAWPDCGPGVPGRHC